MKKSEAQELSYLADDLANVRVPMGMLTTLTGETVPSWGFSHQRAFEEIKGIVAESRDHYRVPLKYGAPTRFHGNR